VAAGDGEVNTLPRAAAPEKGDTAAVGAATEKLPGPGFSKDLGIEKPLRIVETGVVGDPRHRLMNS
jgi:hypothetical protein